MAGPLGKRRMENSELGLLITGFAEELDLKRKAFFAAAVLLLLFMAVFFGTGFRKNPSVYIEDYSVSEDGGEIALRMAVSSSAGRIRKVSVHRQEGGKLVLDCYSAFGGWNGSVGAKDTFVIPLGEDARVIAIRRSADRCEEALCKGEDGVWRRAAQTPGSLRGE